MKVFRKAGNELELLYRQHWQKLSLSNLQLLQNPQNTLDTLELDKKSTDFSSGSDV